MENKVVKYKDFNKQNEDMYAPNENGEMVKLDYELYKDFYPTKFKVSKLEDNEDKQLYMSEYVWVLKYKDEIVATFSSDLSEDSIKKYVDILQNTNETETEEYENL